MKKFLFILCSVFLLTGCTDKSVESSMSEIVSENQTESSTVVTEETTAEVTTEYATEEISLPENAVSIEKAEEILLHKLQNYGYSEELDYNLVYDSTKIFDYRPCYVFRSYDDFDDHRATTGWYAVNPATGECIDIITEPMPLFYRFEITEYGIEVYEKYSDEPFQNLSIDPDLPNPEWLYKMNEKYNNPYQFIKMNDFDFDGYDDIAVQVYLGATNRTVHYYHYNPATQQFENWNELNNLYYGVTPDINNKTLSVDSKSSAVDHYHDVYKWVDNSLSLISEVKQYYDYDDKEIYIDYLEYDDSENENLIKRERLISDENNKLKEEIIIEKTTEKADTNIKQTYREVLENIYYNYKFPQYDEPIRNYDYDISSNEFAVYDVDNDGRDELIVMFTAYYTAGQLASVYDHDSNGNLILQFSGYPLMDFYENGAVKVYSAHNQTHSLKVHPFTMYEYNSEADSYNKCGIVYALDKDIVDMINQEKEEVGMTNFLDYPAEYDTSNSGTVYYICPDWDKGAAIPIDVTEFNERYEQFTEGSELLEIPFMKLTEENIKTVNQ